MTTDGCDDELIQPEGLPDYKVLPPSVLDPRPAAPTGLVSNNIEQEDQDELLNMLGFI